MERYIQFTKIKDDTSVFINITSGQDFYQDN